MERKLHDVLSNGYDSRELPFDRHTITVSLSTTIYETRTHEPIQATVVVGVP